MADTASSPASSPTAETRPWGAYQVIDGSDTFKAKRITVEPGHRLSYQRHQRRAEHWVVVDGTARVTLDGEVIELDRGHAVDIPQGAKHRIENPGPVPLVFVEVQLGDYFGEDDIERFDDDYERA